CSGAGGRLARRAAGVGGAAGDRPGPGRLLAPALAARGAGRAAAAARAGGVPVGLAGGVGAAGGVLALPGRGRGRGPGGGGGGGRGGGVGGAAAPPGPAGAGRAAGPRVLLRACPLRGEGRARGRALGFVSPAGGRVRVGWNRVPRGPPSPAEPLPFPAAPG